MAPQNRSGRPRNAWTPSWRRKLVRLHTLTKLSKEEIQKVFAIHGFSTCQRDITSQLCALLPSDHGKFYKKYRPSDNRSMKLRFDNLRRCKKGRISKQRAAKIQAKLTTPGNLSRTTQNNFEGCPLAFRNYAAPSEISLIPLTSDLLNSQPVFSSRLLLDGSSLPASPGHGLLPHGDNQIVLISDSSDRQYVQSPADTTRKVVSEPPMLTPSSHENLRKISSLRGLGKEFLDNHPESYVKHINSVFRYSSSNSWRSSITSLSSHTGSILSKLSDRRKSLTTATRTRFSKSIKSTSRSDPNISEWIEEIWDELVDEERLDCRPLYEAISPLNRKCCAPPQSVGLICENCGFSPEHRRAVEYGTIKYGNRQLINQLDFFKNTPLHCAAASAKPYEFWKIIKIIDQGAHYHGRNTSGETFLHSLCQNGLRTATDILDFINIIRQLSVNKFPLNLPDFHGRTPLHHLFQHADILKNFQVHHLSEILSIMNPNLNAVDNSGTSVRSLLDACISRRGKTGEDFRLAVRLFYEKLLHSPQYQFLQELDSLLAVDDLQLWLKKICQSTGPNWIDTLGDTPLTGLLKSRLFLDQDDDGMRRMVETMIAAGVEIHMRDRNGNTALAISARLGFRLVVDLLLERGSDVFCRNYRGVGILGQTMESMEKAFGNDRLWALIYNCHMALVDAGAMENPTDLDEWMIPAPERQSLLEIPGITLFP